MGPEFVHETTVQVRYGETDQMGVVYHANYLVYMEEGRTRFMESLGLPYHELERRGFGLVVRKATLRFRAPARYADQLTVRTRIDKVGGASILFAYEIHRGADGAAVADGTTELACIDLRKPGRPVCMLPDDLRGAEPPAQAGRS
ncbi:MAG: acyl-CoA thioesterase [Planctomycetes bacterium]|nr:acyl-CoA thioesterase [Planctomycetota bacterium]